MNHQKRLGLAMNFHVKRNLDFWTKKLGSESKARIHLRNVAIEWVMDDLDRQQHHHFYDQRIINVYAHTPEMAAYHGVKEGSIISQHRQKHPDYNARWAKLKRQLRAIAVEMQLAQINPFHYHEAGAFSGCIETPPDTYSPHSLLTNLRA